MIYDLMELHVLTKFGKNETLVDWHDDAVVTGHVSTKYQQIMRFYYGQGDRSRC